MARKAASQPVALDPSMRIVVLHGKERFLIEEHTRRFAEMLEKKFDGLEQFNFDGETVQPATVLDELRSYGLMQKHKLVILDKADVFLAGGKGGGEDEDEGKAASPARKLMEKYAAKPVDDATLLMRAATWRPGNLNKLIAKVGGVFQCEPPSPEQAAEWCVRRCAKRYETVIERDAAYQLVARIGPELQHLDTELQKLAAAAGAGGTIDRRLVIQMVGLSRDEKAWEIQSAILTCDAGAMLAKLRELIQVSRQDVVPLNWSVCDLLRKLHAAAQLLARGVPAGSIGGQLRLWPNADPIIAVARRAKPSDFAQLLQAAIDTDRAAKSGLGEPVRTLESLLVRIADKFQGK